MLLADAGNFASESTDFEYWNKTEFSWDLMAKLGYDVVTPGDRELVKGADAAVALFAKHPEVKVVSANIKNKAGKFLFPRYAIIEKGGVTYGVTGVTGASYYNFNVTRGRQEKDDVTFEDSEDALKEVVPELRQKADLVVALIHEGPGDVNRMLEKIKDIDVVVVGHNPGYMFNPDRAGSTLVLRGGTKGQYCSVLRLTMDDSGKKILDYNGEGKPLDDAIAKDDAIEKVVKPWEDEYKKRQDLATRQKAASDAMLQGTERYVGAEMCARCHAEEYSRWLSSPHGHAFQDLVAEHKETDSECLKCHVVGYGQFTGYPLVSATAPPPTQTAENTLPAAKLTNVQCESCHGMGTFHGTDMMQASPSEETCRTCHQGDYEKDFNYAQALAKGIH